MANESSYKKALMQALEDLNDIFEYTTEGQPPGLDEHIKESCQRIAAALNLKDLAKTTNRYADCGCQEDQCECVIAESFSADELQGITD